MRKLEIKDAEIMRIAVQQEILQSEESRYDHRLHGILLVCSGLSCAAPRGSLDIPGISGMVSFLAIICLSAMVSNWVNVNVAACSVS